MINHCLPPFITIHGPSPLTSQVRRVLEASPDVFATLGLSPEVGLSCAGARGIWGPIYPWYNHDITIIHSIMMYYTIYSIYNYIYIYKLCNDDISNNIAITMIVSHSLCNCWFPTAGLDDLVWSLDKVFVLWMEDPQFSCMAMACRRWPCLLAFRGVP